MGPVLIYLKDTPTPQGSNFSIRTDFLFPKSINVCLFQVLAWRSVEVESWETTSKVLPCKVSKVILYSAIYFLAMRQLNCFPMSSEHICRFARTYIQTFQIKLLHRDKLVPGIMVCLWQSRRIIKLQLPRNSQKLIYFWQIVAKIRPHLHVYKPFFTGLAQLRNGDFLPSSTEATLNTCMPTSPWGQPSYWGNSDTIDAISVTQQ